MATDNPVVKTPDEARQAQQVGLWKVLVWGLVLVVVAFGLIYFWMK